jgi:hypothetical protein
VELLVSFSTNVLEVQKRVRKDFFLWGFLKNTVYLNHLYKWEDLQTGIQHAANAILTDMSQSVLCNMIYCRRLCEEYNGHCLQQFMGHVNTLHKCNCSFLYK